MRSKLLFTITLICFLLLQKGFGQEKCSFEIRGKVLVQESHKPISNAVIWVEAIRKGALSDQNGNFQLDNVCEGHYILSVKVLGYREHKQQLNVHGNIDLTIRMLQGEYTMEEIEVTGHQEAIHSTGTVSSLEGEILDERRGENLGETLKKIAGVNSFSTGASISKPVIHGLHSNRIMIMNNGVKQEGQQWGVEHAPEIDPFMAEQITVVKGAEAVRFGPEAMGGVILLDPPKLPISDTKKGEFHLIGNTNGRSGTASFTYEGGSSKWKGLGYRVQASGKTSGNIQSPSYFQNNTGLRELNFSGALGYSSKKLGVELFYSRFDSKMGILSEAHTGNLSDLEAIIENGRPFGEGKFSYSIQNPRQEVLHQIWKTKAHYHLKNDGVLNFKYAFQKNNRQEYDKRRGGNNDRAALDLELFSNTFDFSYDHPVKDHWNGSIGLSVLQQVNNNIPGTGVTPLIPNYDLINLGVYAIEKFTKGHVELEGGIRYDYRYSDAARYDADQELIERDFTFNNLTAFIGGIYSFNSSWMISSNIGSAWRPPNINEQFSQGLHHGAAAVEIGNPDFKSEQAYKWVNTLYHTHQKGEVELTAYYNKINNYIFLNPTGEQFVSLRGTFNVYQYEQTNAALWGLDLSSHYQLLPFSSWYFRASLIRAKDLESRGYLPFIPTDRIDTGISFTKENIGSFTQNKFTLNSLIVFKQNRAPDSEIAPSPELTKSLMPGSVPYFLWGIKILSKPT
ncbi:TonB-dependent receptor [Echinicola jeungdonensis]|uniref:TonB-dependent receptor n=1 Tax=Echinicola jeungdonensis TaxID=709343 RepID=UPI0025B53212|nr:TonB-dependent receptor [Echinicola jeungdonensis]MDN3670578.1 TonB-dependent receptor [Echinicola jeungdonensis]